MDNYKDIDGNPCTLQALCRKEPEWAASQIATLKDYTTGNEKVIATLRARVKELEAEPRCHCKWTTEPGKPRRRRTTGRMWGGAPGESGRCGSRSA